MSKYIRTKDGRITEIKENMVVKGDDVARLVYKEKPYLCVLNGDDEILKQADNIEDLCDECISWEEGEKMPITDSLEEKASFNFTKDMILLGLANGMKCWLKLGIWTDKGLIFVARMNNKGVLELL